VPDRAERSLEEVRTVRDAIEAKVCELLDTRAEAIWADRSAHELRLERLLPQAPTRRLEAPPSAPTTNAPLAQAKDRLGPVLPDAQDDPPDGDWRELPLIKSRLAGGYCIRTAAQGVCAYTNLCEHCPNFRSEPAMLAILSAQRWTRKRSPKTPNAALERRSQTPHCAASPDAATDHEHFASGYPRAMANLEALGGERRELAAARTETAKLTDLHGAALDFLGQPRRAQGAGGGPSTRPRPRPRHAVASRPSSPTTARPTRLRWR